MGIKEELEVLRGEPIGVFTGDPISIPCIETSDSEKLCKRPVVSVQMITYNHEPYIRQAIEGVMMQKTDFEFELVIGEDCSQDKTREICFEYQKKYPDKIRVLWWHENVSKLGGNGRRTRSRCRGEYIAYCEGDDFWTDPLKLQKQVDVMRQHPNVGLCFGGVNVFYEQGKRLIPHRPQDCVAGSVRGTDFINFQLYGVRSGLGRAKIVSMQTSGLLIRRSVLEAARRKYEIFTWRLLIGDVVVRLGCASMSNVWFVADAMSTYRKNTGGVTMRRFAEVMRDDMVVAQYFSVKAQGLSWEESLRRQEKRVVRTYVNNAVAKGREGQRKFVQETIPQIPVLKEFFGRFWAVPLKLLLRLGCLTPKLAFHVNRLYWHAPRFWIFR